jgi:hypothetical protein
MLPPCSHSRPGGGPVYTHRQGCGGCSGSPPCAGYLGVGNFLDGFSDGLRSMLMLLLWGGWGVPWASGDYGCSRSLIAGPAAAPPPAPRSPPPPAPFNPLIPPPPTPRPTTGATGLLLRGDAALLEELGLLRERATGGLRAGERAGVVGSGRGRQRPSPTTATAHPARLSIV